jgi:hypothetical protein
MIKPPGIVATVVFDGMRCNVFTWLLIATLR